MNIGEKILEKLQKEISQNDYERYIKKLHYDIGKSGDTLALFIAPNILISKWVQNKYWQFTVMVALYFCRVKANRCY